MMGKWKRIVEKWNAGMNKLISAAVQRFNGLGRREKRSRRKDKGERGKERGWRRSKIRGNELLSE